MSTLENIAECKVSRHPKEVYRSEEGHKKLGASDRRGYHNSGVSRLFSLEGVEIPLLHLVNHKGLVQIHSFGQLIVKYCSILNTDGQAHP